MKTIKLKLTDELKWLERVHPSTRSRLIRYALSKLSRDEILQFLLGEAGNEEEKGEAIQQEIQQDDTIKELENW